MPQHHDLTQRLSTTAYAPARLAGLGLSAMLVPLGSTMIAVALPSIGAEFGRSSGDLTQWLVNSYLLVTLIALGPSGKLADHWGYRPTLRLGQALFGAGCLLPIVWHAFAALVAGRMLMALGGALMVPTVMAVFKTAVPAERRHRVFGYFSAMMGSAAALGPSLGGLLADRFGWGAIFVMNLPPLLLSVTASLGFFKPGVAEAPRAPLRFDWIGTALLTVGLAALVVGLKDPPGLLLLALAALAAFVGWQTRAPQPLVELSLFANRHYAAGCAMIALQNLAMYALLFELPYLLRLLFGWGPEQAGHLMTTFMLSNMASSALGGRVAERLGVRRTCTIGSLLSAVGMVLLALLASQHNEWHLVAGLALSGIGLGLANGPSQSAAMGTVEHRLTGIASGVLSISRYLGGVFGVSVLGLLMSTPAPGADTFTPHGRALWVYAAAFALAALVSRALPGLSPSSRH